MISNPTLSLPECNGTDRRCALWDCVNQRWEDWLSSMNPFRLDKRTVNTNLAFLHTSVLWTFINHVLFFSWNLPISSISFHVDRSLLYPIEVATFLCREYVWCNNLYSKCGY